tara:strand:+ start:368 stop:1177 length:810 start_codon:yes stop_codon:yes gene_type:complete
MGLIKSYRSDRAGNLAVQGGPTWEKLLITEAPVSRTVNRSDDEAIVTSASTSGNVNSVTLADVASNLGSGTAVNNNNCAIYAWPLTDKDGFPILHDMCFSVRIFINVTASPGNEDNDCFIMAGISDGATNMTTGRCGGGMIWDNATGRKPVTSGIGTGITKGTADADSLGAIVQINTLPPGCKFTVNTLYTYLLDSGNDLERERSSMAQHLYQGSASAPAERKVDPVYIALWLGRTANGAGNKNFSFEMYYSVDPGCTYKGFSNNDPLW